MRAVAEAFGAPAEALTLLPGGQGTTWRAGEVILKPAGDLVIAAWSADVLASLEPSGYRVPRPVRSITGQWVVEGWCAWTVVAGEHGSAERSAEVFEVSRRLHADLRHLPDPGFGHRDDVWARGDRAAWSSAPYEAINPELGELIARLAPLREDEGLPEQVVHADLFGNVLFADGLAPAVIDLSPYYRPAEWALAVAVVDGQAWYGQAPTDAGLPYARSLLARAAMFRLVTSDHAATGPAYVTRAAADWGPVVARICGSR